MNHNETSTQGASPLLKNILAVIAGFVIGGAINMGLIMLSPSIIPPPEGVDVMDPESMAAHIDKFEMVHFIMPFLAHALGVLVGAFITAKVALSHNYWLAMFIGVFFLLGGIVASQMIPAPTTFIAIDLLLAYIPMAWIGWKLAGGVRGV